MDKLKLNLRRVAEPGVFHDSRKDVRLLSDCINKIVEKLNAVIEENNHLKQEIKSLKNTTTP